MPNNEKTGGLFHLFFPACHSLSFSFSRQLQPTHHRRLRRRHIGKELLCLLSSIPIPIWRISFHRLTSIEPRDYRVVCVIQKPPMVVSLMQMSDCNNARKHIRILIGIGLVKHTLVAVAHGSGLVGIDAGDQNQFVRHLFAYLCKTGNVVHNRILVIRRARTDNKKLFIRFADEHLGNIRIKFLFFASTRR